MNYFIHWSLKIQHSRNMKKLHITIILLAALSLGVNAQNKKSIDGFWLGTLKVESMELRLAFTITNSADGNMEALLTSIDQNNAEVPMDEVILNVDTLVVSHPPMGLKIKGVVNRDGKSWITEFTQGSLTAPLIFNKVDQLPH